MLIAIGLAMAAISASAQQVSIPSGGVKFKPSHPKYSTALSQVLSHHRGMTPMDKLVNSGFGAFQAKRHYMMTFDERLQVYVWLHDWEPASLQALRDAGLDWKVDDPDQRVIQAVVPVSLMGTIANMDFVRAITLPNYTYFNVGQRTTSGDLTLRTEETRTNYTLSGAGVKVGVLSDGFGSGVAMYEFPNNVFESCTAEITVETIYGTFKFPDPNTCDLPPVIAPPFEADEPALDDCVSLLFTVDDKPTTVTDTTIGNISGSFGKVRYRSFIDNELIEEDIRAVTGNIFKPGSEEFQPYLITVGAEGTALMEIIHDIAPDAQLFFANFNTTLEFLQAKKWLVGQGVDIICDDIGVFGEGPLDGTSPNSMLNANITRMGIDYVTAVGNFQQFHIRSRYTENPFNPIGVHNFRLPATAAQQGDTSFDMIMPRGEFYIITLVWQNQFDNPIDDLDIFLLDSRRLDIAQPLAFSVDSQGPAALGLNAPVENIFFNHTIGPTEISLVITRKEQQPVNRPGPVFDVFFWYGFQNVVFREPQYMTPYGAITNNNDAAGDVISVGAINGIAAQNNEFVLEPFSSFGETWDNRKKPELCAVDGVNVRTAGFSPFFGTSAAAPHVAGGLALLKEFYPGITPAQGRSYMMAFAKDLFPGQAFPEYNILDATGPDAISGAGLMDMVNVADFVAGLNASNFAPISRLYTFDTDAEGWVTQSLVDFGFNAPVFGSGSGALTMEGGGTLSYGSWISPKIDFPGTPLRAANGTALLGGAVYLMRANISSTAGSDAFPSFRLRLSNFRNESVAERVFNSPDGNSIAPGIGRDYFVYFVPDSVGLLDGLFAAVDLLNFNNFDDVSSTLSINEVEIIEVQANIPEP